MNTTPICKRRRLKTDLFRIMALLVIVGLLLWYSDPANVVVFQSGGIAMFLAGCTHITRRVLFNRLDLQQIAAAAVDGSVGAAIVFASICVFLIAVMWLAMAVLS